MSTDEQVGGLASSLSPSSSAERTEELREELAAKVAEQLRVPVETARAIVAAFDEHVARPLETKFARLTPYDLGQRNPFFIAALGISTVDEWVDRALADRETSALEGHIGTFLEEAARIVSGGFKPGSGVDVQRELDDGTVELYSLQMASNTKSSGGRQAEINNLRRAAAPLRAARRHVVTSIGVMFGRRASGELRADASILTPSSEELWQRLSGQENFLPRLLEATRLLSSLVTARAADDAARLKAEAVPIFADAAGTLDLKKLAGRPARPQARRRLT